MQIFVPFLAGVALFYLFQYFPFTTVFTSLLSAVYLLSRKQVFLILILLSGIAFAFIRYEPVREIPQTRAEVALRGIFESYPVKTDSGSFKQILRVKSAVDKESGLSVNELAGREVTILSDREFEPGTECDATAKFLKSKKRLNPGEPARDELYAYLSDIRPENTETFISSKIEECRYRLSRYINKNFNKNSGAFIASLTIGQTANIGEELRGAFNSTGLTHILSISGSHFGLFSVFLFGIFRFLIKASPYRLLQRITIFLTPSQAAATLCLPFMLAYLGLSGYNIPAVRSFIMISLFLIGLVIGRKGFWLNSLLFAAFALAVWEPEVIFDLSAQLSFIAVLFIGFSLGDRDVEKTEDEKRGDKKIFRYVKNSALLTLSASIGTAPLVAYHFHYLSVISPISNLLIGPFIGFILVPLSVISSFVFLISGDYIFAPIVSPVADISISSVRLLSRLPFADIRIPAFPPIIVLLFYSGFAFYFLFNKKRSTLIIPFVPIIMWLLLSLFEKNELKITYLDVGQGDSSVIELPDGKTMVIDTGRTGRETASFLKYRGKKTVDVLILSHSHPDHAGGLDYISNRFTVRELWYSGRFVLPGTLNSGTVRTLSRGDVVEGGEYSIYVLHPYPDFYTMNANEYVAANNDSLLLKLECNGMSFLFAGDIEEEAETDILQLGRWLKSDVIKVPHHGGKTSSPKSFIDAVSPDIAVISAGRDNAFGHPHQDTLDALQEVQVFRTDLDGATRLSKTAQGFKSTTYKNSGLKKARSFDDEMKNVRRLFVTW